MKTLRKLRYQIGTSSWGGCMSKEKSELLISLMILMGQKHHENRLIKNIRCLAKGMSEPLISLMILMGQKHHEHHVIKNINGMILSN